MPRPPAFSDLDAALAALGPDARCTKPSRPAVKLLSEARRLYAVVEPERSRFAALPELDIAALDQLPELTRRAQSAEVAWGIRRQERSRLAARRKRDEAIALRSRLVSAIRYVRRADESLQRRLVGLRKRRTLPGIVADLRWLASIVDEQPGAFATAPALPAEPAQAARVLVEELIRGGYSPEADKAQHERNAAFVLLGLAVSEVRAAGRFLFRHEPKLLARMCDEVTRGQRGRPKRAPPPTPAAADGEHRP